MRNTHLIPPPPRRDGFHLVVLERSGGDRRANASLAAANLDVSRAPAAAALTAFRAQRLGLASVRG